MRIYLKRCNILQERVDAIVNPANSTGAMASGIGAAIKNAGSGSIEKAAREQAPIAIGTAILTPGYNLAAAHVIHAPTTNRVVEEVKVENIRLAVRAALAIAEHHQFVSLSFPGMGNLIGQVKHDAVAEAMVDELTNFKPNSLQEIIVVPQDHVMEAAFRKALHAHGL